MSNNELLQGISKLMDVKLKPIYKRFDEMETEINISFEAIEQKFESIEVKIDQLEGSLNARINQLETSLNARIDQVDLGLRAEVHNLWLIVEGEVRTDIKKIVENFPDLNKMKRTADSIEQLKADVDIHDHVISEHSERILELEKIS